VVVWARLDAMLTISIAIVVALFGLVLYADRTW
jgi:hypothetical protein